LNIYLENAPKSDSFTWRHARYRYEQNGIWHPTLSAVRTGFLYVINGQEVFEYVALSNIPWVDWRGAWGVVREKTQGFRWFE